MYLFLLIVSVVYDSPLVVFFVEVIFVKKKHTQTSNLVWVFLCWIDIFLEKNDKKDFDKAAEDLRLATRHLGMIVGKVDVEEILGSIFNDFCIGK